MTLDQEPETPFAFSPRFLYAMQQYIVSTFSEADWYELAYYVGCPDIVRCNPALLAALREGDPSYRVRVFEALERLHEQRSSEELTRQIGRIRRTAATDPEIAIGQAKEMLETVMKAILGQHDPNADIDII